MIARVSPRSRRHDDMGQLVAYLFGPGRANEHTDPRVVACSEAVEPDLPPPALAARLEAPAKLFDTRVSGGSVWHTALSNAPGDRVLADAEWGFAARRLVDSLGFGGADGTAPCRWAAVRHGVSARGNDHIHVVVSLVREDGTVASVWQDRVAAARVCAALEDRFGLARVEGRRHGGGMPGYTRAEAEQAARRGRTEPERPALARRVRAAAVAGADEADFVHRLRASGVLVRARRPDPGAAAEGYAVALPSPDGTDPVWFGGGRLAADLTLPRLRRHWPDADHHAAAHAWDEPAPHAALPAPPDAWTTAARTAAAAVARLAADPALWPETARQLAGTLAVLAAGEHQAAAFARAADRAARSAPMALPVTAPAGPDPIGLAAVARAVAETPATAADRAARAALVEHLAGLLGAGAAAERRAGKPRQARALTQAAADLRAARGA
ncbi:hypothetical protein LO772_22615 [Yinghuangia sp. ASG 101]|uniref:relaxase/mobilization nuclease domain-containing protein n=1 Tax=Yinghuangia sp. ASG 101 TaxID=2896848 RepID=UPI001E4F56FB|nr:hypothetical protein [Yinghuangia sp. ASG 101]UGQ09698.1 hypothetical protein LO772_22615 [Yinghuangia sp. ASG 101]